jgi:hypothetical protein
MADLCSVCGNPPGDGHLRRGMCRKHSCNSQKHTKSLLQFMLSRVG